MTTTTSLFDQIFNFNGNFGKAPEGMFKLSAAGDIAVKTSAGYRAYNFDKEYLVNCTLGSFDFANGMFYVWPTNKVKPGDVILVNKQPRCVLSVNGRTIEVVNYEAGIIEQMLPERHMFLNRMYFYGRVINPFQGMFSKTSCIKGMAQMAMMSEMMKINGGEGVYNPLGGDGALFAQMMQTQLQMKLFNSLMGGKGDDGGMDGLFDDMFDGFDEDAEDEKPKAKPAPKAKAKAKAKPAAPKSVAIVEESADGGAQG